MHAGAKPEIFKFAEELRMKMTPAEKYLWEYLKKKPLGYKFRRQHPFYKYILDFYCHKQRLAIEIDGNYHNTRSQKELDSIRTEDLKVRGVNEIRFTNVEVESNPLQVVKQILTRMNVDKQKG